MFLQTLHRFRLQHSDLAGIKFQPSHAWLHDVYCVRKAVCSIPDLRSMCYELESQPDHITVTIIGHELLSTAILPFSLIHLPPAFYWRKYMHMHLTQLNRF